MEEPSDSEQRIAKIEAELAQQTIRRNQLLDELGQMRQQLLHKKTSIQLSLPVQVTSLTNQSSQEEKIRLYRCLFRGREDVFPRRFENSRTGKSGYAPVCRNEWVAGVCEKPKISCQECKFRAFVPVSDEMIRSHLMGHDPNEPANKDFTMGVYPLLSNETCWFLAIDFDKSAWAEDAKAFLETCMIYHVPAILERSRSGNGGHVWIFNGSMG